MLTLATPAMNRALAGTFNTQQLAQFMASVGQCTQPLQHRAGLSVAPGSGNAMPLPGGMADAGDGPASGYPTGIPEDDWWSSDWYGNSNYTNTDNRSYYNGGDSSDITKFYGWNPNSYPGLFPTASDFFDNYARNDPYSEFSYPDYINGGNFYAGDEYNYTGEGSPSYLNNNFFEAPKPGSYRGGDFISHYYGSPYFDLQTNLNQELNQYYAENKYDGNTINFNNPTNVSNLYSQVIDAREIKTEIINGQPAGPGPAGPQGQPGLDGGAFFFPLPGGGGGGGFDPTLINIRLRNLENKNAQIINVINGMSLKTTEADVLTGVTFDSNVCDVTPEDTEVVRTVELLKPGAGAL